MRSLSVSFQSDAISVAFSKKEKPITSVSYSYCTLRPTSNVAAHKQVETPTTRKPNNTPERKRSPLKWKNNDSDHSENSKPVDSRIGRKVSSNNVSTRSVESSTDKAAIRTTLHNAVPRTGSSPRRLSLSKEVNKPLQKSSSDTARLLMILESGKIGSEVKKPVDDCSPQIVRPHKFVSANSSEKIGLATPAVRSQSLPTLGLRPPSPSRTLVLSSSSSKGLSPSRSRPSTPSRGVSPSGTRPTDSSSPTNGLVSVLSFIDNSRRGKKGAAHIEDAHQLRLLYNRYLQWRFAKARAEAVLYIKNANVKRTLFNVWNATLSLWESVVRKRINVQKLKLDIKLNSVLNDQMAYLNEWAILEGNHVDALAGISEDFKAGTLRLPLTGGALADIEHLKVAICSAVDIMQLMGSTICSSLSRVEDMNNLVSGLAVVAAQEKAMLVESEAFLASVAAKQVEENSLRTHLMQMKQALGTNK